MRRPPCISVEIVCNGFTRRIVAVNYDEWAEDYDADLREEFDWIARVQTVELFATYVERDAWGLDSGVGTDLVVECLIDAAYPPPLHGRKIRV